MSLVFFSDRDLGKQFPEILRTAGFEVERHDQHFLPATPDEEWLKEIGRRGWIAITHDKRIRHKPNELAAVMTHQVALLVVIGQAPFADLARSFVATRTRIERFVSRNPPPYIAKVYRAATTEPLASPIVAGRIEKWYP